MGHVAYLAAKLLEGWAAVQGWPVRELITIGACLAFSAFFSAAETALTALGEARSRQLLESGAGVGLSFLRTWLERPEQVLATLLLGNTFANIGASALATAIFERHFEHAVALATGVMTFLVLYVSEVAPKTFAKVHPEFMARRILLLTSLFYFVLWPVAYPLFRMTTAVNRLLARRRGMIPAPVVTSADVDYVIGLGTREGVLDKVKEELLNSVLEFGDIVVKEIMTPRTQMIAVDRDSPMGEILGIVDKGPYSRFPVYQGSIDNIVGVLHAKPLLADLRGGTDQAKLRLETYIRVPFFVPEGMKISRLLKEFQRRRLHLAIVVDEFGGTSGLITLEDVIEELIGEIPEESEVDEGPFKVLSDGMILADGAAPLRDLVEVLKIEFPEQNDYETLGGFLTTQGGSVPPSGAVLTFGGYSFMIVLGDERRVGKVEIRKLRTETGAQRAASGRSSPGSQPGPAARPQL